MTSVPALLRRALGLGILLGGLPGSLWAQQPPAPCSAPEHRAFDFWIGTWDVFTPNGQQAGTNTIRSTMNGCVLHESYDGQGGYHGESFNVYDASRGVWHQSWVDNGGLLLSLEGGLEGDAMVLTGTTYGPEGEPVLNRITWTPLPGAPARVRQHWEVSTDGGAQWRTGFDGEYRKRGG